MACDGMCKDHGLSWSMVVGWVVSCWFILLPSNEVGKPLKKSRLGP